MHSNVFWHNSKTKGKNMFAASSCFLRIGLTRSIKPILWNESRSNWERRKVAIVRLGSLSGDFSISELKCCEASRYDWSTTPSSGDTLERLLDQRTVECSTKETNLVAGWKKYDASSAASYHAKTPTWNKLVGSTFRIKSKTHRGWTWLGRG